MDRLAELQAIVTSNLWEKSGWLGNFSSVVQDFWAVCAA